MQAWRDVPLGLWLHELHWKTTRWDILLFRQEAFRREQEEKASIAKRHRNLYIKNTQWIANKMRGLSISFYPLSSRTRKHVETRARELIRKVAKRKVSRRWLHSNNLKRYIGRETKGHNREWGQWADLCPWWNVVNYRIRDFRWFEENESVEMQDCLEEGYTGHSTQDTFSGFILKKDSIVCKASAIN